MNGILMALFGTLGTFLITALGAAGIFFVRREVSGNLQCGFLGFAGGVMIAASVWSLLLPGIDFAEANGQVGWLVMTGGFLLGVITLLVADGLMKAWYEREKKYTAYIGEKYGNADHSNHNSQYSGRNVSRACICTGGTKYARYGVVVRCGCTGDRNWNSEFPRRDGSCIAACERRGK